MRTEATGKEKPAEKVESLWAVRKRVESYCVSLTSAKGSPIVAISRRQRLAGFAASRRRNAGMLLRSPFLKLPQPCNNWLPKQVSGKQLVCPPQP